MSESSGKETVMRFDRMRCHRLAGVAAFVGAAMVVGACDTASGPAQGSGSRTRTT